jgi:hypothetical protein
MRGIFSNFSTGSCDLLVLVSGLPTLEVVLPIIWNEKKLHPCLRATIIFAREGNLTGFGKSNPLLKIAMEVCDEIWVPFGPLLLLWNGHRDDWKLDAFMGLSSKLSRGISTVLTRRIHAKIKDRVERIKKPYVTCFDYGYLPADNVYGTLVSGVADTLLIGVNHGATLSFSKSSEPRFEETRRDGTYFTKIFADIFPRKEMQFYFDRMVDGVSIGTTFVNKTPIERSDPDWLKHVAKIFKTKALELSALGNIGLLMSRHAPKKPLGTQEELDPGLRRRALQDVRAAFESNGLTPVIMLHPSEPLVGKELKGWVVIDDIHFSLLFQAAKAVVTFGTTLSEDYWRSGGSMIEYAPIRLVPFISEFAKSNKTIHATNPEELEAAIRLKGKGYFR